MKITFSPSVRGILLTILVAAAKAAPPTTFPAAPAIAKENSSAHDRIVRFSVIATPSTGHPETAGQSLKIEFSDGHADVVPPEFGRQSDGEHTVRQSEFVSIQLADDHRTIGWLATYMICAQSYPCPVELAIYRAGHVIQRIRPGSGIFWNWMFRDNGTRVAVHHGFPHGDSDGAYALYVVETGRSLASYVTGPKRPTWVKALDSVAQ